jgi:drug/metabolite transporter (DMT)-like permease
VSDAPPSPSIAPRTRLAGILFVNLATLTWATNIALGRWMRHEIGPITLAAGRYIVASALLAFLLTREPRVHESRSGNGGSVTRPKRERWPLLAMALTGVALFAPTLYLGLRYTTSVNATLINSFAPLITGVLSGILIGEAMSRRQVTGALAGLAGVLVLISGGSLAVLRSVGVNWGDLLIVVAATLWSLYSVFGRRAMRGHSVLQVTAWSSILGTPVLIAAAAWEMQALPPAVSTRLILLIVYIAVVPSVGGILAWNAGVRRLGASGAMVFYNTLPVYGALIGYLFLGEAIGLTHLVGGALIAGGGLWAART